MADIGTSTVFYAARPALYLDGEEQSGLANALLGLTVEETVEGLYCCEANFSNWGAARGGVGFLYFDRQVLDFGKTIQVEMGEGEAARQIFEGRIMALEGRFPHNRAPELQVLAEDRFQDLRMIRRSRTFEDSTDSDVMRQIAGEHGLHAEIDVDAPSYRVLAQLNQSDLAFLRERARNIDAELWVEGETLHAQARSRRRLTDVSLTYGQSLREFSVTADLATQRSSVTVSGWDVQGKDSLDEEAGPSEMESELEGRLGGSRLLQQALGERPDRIVHLSPLGGHEARVLAQAYYRRGARRFLCGRGVADGDARLRVGAHVSLENIGDLFEGTYYVTSVQHVFEPLKGFRSCFCVEGPGLGES